MPPELIPEFGNVLCMRRTSRTQGSPHRGREKTVTLSKTSDSRLLIYPETCSDSALGFCNPESVEDLLSIFAESELP